MSPFAGTATPKDEIIRRVGAVLSEQNVEIDTRPRKRRWAKEASRSRRSTGLWPYDIVGIVDTPDDETATAALLSVAGQGNVRTTTQRAFSASEMRV
jgi:hypothetical protein